MTVEVMQQESPIVANLDPTDSWKRMLIHYLQNPFCGTNFKIRQRALNYVLVGDELYIEFQWGAFAMPRQEENLQGHG